MKYYFPEQAVPCIADSAFDRIVSYLHRIECLVLDLTLINYSLFGTVEGLSSKLSYKRYELQEDFLELIQRVKELCELYSFGCFPVPIVSFMTSVNQMYEDFDFSDEESLTDDMLNRCIEDIHLNLKNPPTRRKQYALEEQVNDRNNSSKKLINSLFDHHGRILALRMDFGYRLDRQHSLQYVCMHRDRLIRLISTKNQKIGEALLGYIWKLEYGFDKSYHLHMLILLDGNQLQRDVVLGERIGECWNNDITGGDGTYYNCNAFKDKYKKLGIGKIEHYEIEKRHNLIEECANYLTKHDHYMPIVKVMEAEIIKRYGDRRLYNELLDKRVFGTSRVKRSEGKKLGRARTR